MKVYEYGKENPKTLLMFQCSAEPCWVFDRTVRAMAQDFHVYFAAAEGHNPEEDSTFVSVEKWVDDAVAYLKAHGVNELYAVYGVSFGGSAVMRLLATQAIPVKKAIIDAGVTPYPYPLIIRKFIALKDLVSVRLLTKSIGIAKKVMSPERWTPAGEDPEDWYRRIFDFLGSKQFTAKTIYHAFWSANNWSCPDPVPAIDTEIEYWYGEEEKKARAEHLAWAQKHFPQLKPVEFPGLAHAELVMVQPERFHEAAMRFLKD